MCEFAYTFACTPTLTTRRAPVYIGLPWASALIILWSQVQVLVGPPEMKIPTFGLVFFLVLTKDQYLRLRLSYKY